MTEFRQSPILAMGFPIIKVLEQFQSHSLDIDHHTSPQSPKEIQNNDIPVNDDSFSSASEHESSDPGSEYQPESDDDADYDSSIPEDNDETLDITLPPERLERGTRNRKEPNRYGDWAS